MTAREVLVLALARKALRPDATFGEQADTLIEALTDERYSIVPTAAVDGMVVAIRAAADRGSIDPDLAAEMIDFVHG
jgi:hypothetical protein